jgi:small subunit ribosomal protein S1
LQALTVNRGGVVVNVEGLPGFMPFSQMSKGYVVEELVDKEIPFKILEANEEQMRLILSNKKAVAENQSSYTIGSVVEGTVQSVKPYGAFIDIGTVVGLLHISQISHDRLTSVEAVLAPGDKLKVILKCTCK